MKGKGHPYAADKATMKRYLKQIWFGHYSRARGQSDTSGFEHIFIGEAKNGEISGLHNWLRFYRLERSSSENFDYKGFLVKRGSTLAAIRFSWRNQPKRSGTLLIGTSPEFDMAIYTLCFLSRRGRNTCNVRQNFIY
jgi:poly(U)-specific endoribonuclease